MSDDSKVDPFRAILNAARLEAAKKWDHILFRDRDEDDAEDESSDDE
ncbi:MAG: hypothetical protein WD473_11990 [Acidimicrobiia bacterium]